MNTVKVRNVEIGAGMPKICVPIVGKTKEEILEAGKHISDSDADMAEWRADWYEDVFDVSKVEETLEELREVLGSMPLLFTFRTANEGGEKAIAADEYTALNRIAAQTGKIDLVDVELYMGDETVTEIIEAAQKHHVRVIVSNHDFCKTPPKEEIVSRLCKMQTLGGDILKIAVMPQSKADVLELLAATSQMAEEYADRPVITMSMSGEGVITRLCGEVFGSAVTFGSLGKSSAPGQVAVGKLQGVLQLLHESL